MQMVILLHVFVFSFVFCIGHLSKGINDKESIKVDQKYPTVVPIFQSQLARLKPSSTQKRSHKLCALKRIQSLNPFLCLPPHRAVPTPFAVLDSVCSVLRALVALSPWIGPTSIVLSSLTTSSLFSRAGPAVAKRDGQG